MEDVARVFPLAHTDAIPSGVQRIRSSARITLHTRSEITAVAGESSCAK